MDRRYRIGVRGKRGRFWFPNGLWAGHGGAPPPSAGLSIPAISAQIDTANNAVVAYWDVTKWSDGGTFWDTGGGVESLSYFAGDGALPAVGAVVVDVAADMVLYDLTAASPTAYMTFTRGASNMWDANNAKSVVFVEGLLVLGTAAALYTFDFVNDTSSKITTAGFAAYASTISDRNAASGYGVAAGDVLGGNDVRGCDAVVLAGTKVQASGLAVPNVWVSTENGSSRITPDNTIYSSSETNTAEAVAADSAGMIQFERTSNQDRVSSPDFQWQASFPVSIEKGSVSGVEIGLKTGTVQCGIDAYKDKSFAVAGPAGLTLICKPLNLSAGVTEMRRTLHSNITDVYNTGYMFGDSRTVFAETSTTDSTTTLVNRDPAGGTADATVTGTVELNAANSGDTSVYEGFDASNFATIANDARMDFGTSSAFFGAVIKTADAATARTILQHAAIDGTIGWDLELSTTGTVTATCGSATLESTTQVDDGAFHHLFVTTDGTTVRLYVDGTQEDTASFASTMTVASSVTRIGVTAKTTPDQAFPGSIGHILAGVANFPTAAQVSEMSAFNLSLYAASATTVLPNTSVTAVSHDEDDNELRVGTSGGGVRVWDMSSDGFAFVEDFDAAGTAMTSDTINDISAGEDVAVVATAAEVVVFQDARTVTPFPATGVYNENTITFEGVTTDGSAKAIYKLLIQDGEDRTFTATVNAVNYADATEAAAYTIGGVTPGVVSRTGATTTLDTSPDVVEDSDTTAGVSLAVTVDDATDTVDFDFTGLAATTFKITGTITLSDT